jgi:hypothetical protein
MTRGGKPAQAATNASSRAARAHDPSRCSHPVDLLPDPDGAPPRKTLMAMRARDAPSTRATNPERDHAN